MKTRTRTTWAAALSAAALVGLATGAGACDKATTDGWGQVDPASCAQNWQSRTVYSTNADTYNAIDPNLLVGKDGSPVPGGAGGGNGGYLSETGPDTNAGATGILEVNRFMTGSGPDQRMNVRIPLASLRGLKDAHLRVELPSYDGASWTLTDAGNTALPGEHWGAKYTTYTWDHSGSSASMTAENDQGSVWDVNLSDMAAKTGTVIQFSSPITDAQAASANYANAYLRSYDPTCVPDHPVAVTTTTTKDVPHQVTTTVSTPVTFTAQVDTYSTRRKAGWWYLGRKVSTAAHNLVLTPAERASLVRLDDDNHLSRYEDSAAWGGASDVKFVTFTSDEVAATRGGVYAVIARKTGRTVNPNVTSMADGGSFTKAWILASDANPKAPYGPQGNHAQADVDIVSYAPRTTTVTKTVIDKVPVTTTTWKCSVTGKVVSGPNDSCLPMSSGG